MKLDVAARQRPRSVIPIGQLEVKRVVAAWLAVIAHIHLIEPTPTVDVSGALDMRCLGVNSGVRPTAGPFAFGPPGAGVVIVRTPQNPAVLDPACHTEGPSLTRWCACDPSSTGHEVPTGAHGSA